MRKIILLFIIFSSIIFAQDSMQNLTLESALNLAKNHYPSAKNKEILDSILKSELTKLKMNFIPHINFLLKIVAIKQQLNEFLP